MAEIPADQRHAGFNYTFDVVNVREINAFALPGGPMFVNRGMIEAARTEGEVAGVMAHELSHVVLRHGTAQCSGERDEHGRKPKLTPQKRSDLLRRLAAGEKSRARAGRGYSVHPSTISRLRHYP